MSSIIKFIQEEQVRKRNTLMTSCKEGTEAAIKAMSTINATLFVKTLFDTSLVDSKAIVDEVKAGSSIYDAYISKGF